MPSVKQLFRLVVKLATGLFLLFTACNSQTFTRTIPTPTCYPQPQPTGEKIIRPTIESRPPTQVSPEQVITIVFSGSYVILNNAIVCGETAVKYMHSDEFPSFNWNRTVKVLLDEYTLTTVECGYTCAVEVILPKDIETGTHKLILDTYWENVVFEIQVVKPVASHLIVDINTIVR